MRQTFFYKAFSAILTITLSFHLFAQDIPGWVTNTPDDDEHYYARVEVKTIKMSEQKYKAEANEQALLEISMQIRATVSGTVEMSVTEIDGDITETFGMESYTSTMADIEGAKKVDDYQMAGKYWVLWKLNKSKHKKNIERHIENAKGYYRTFLRMPKDDPVARLEYLIPAYEEVVKVVGQQVIYEDTRNGQMVNIGTEIPNQISRLINEVRLAPDGKVRFTGRAGFSLVKPLKVIIKSASTEFLDNIPVQFNFDDGEGEFSKTVVMTNESGRAETEITKIISRKKVQRIRAKIDLKQWREKNMDRFISFERHLDNISAKNAILFTLDVAQVTQEKIAVITVGDTAVYNESDFKRMNRNLRSEFADVTEFKLKDEALIEGIIENYKRSATLCSNEECQIQIGKKLGVKKLVFIDIADYPKQISITIFLRNIAENELEQEYTYSFDKKENESKDKKIQTILENAPYMVEDFWYRNNPGYLTLNCPVRGVKANFDYLDPTQWMDKTFIKRLPLTGEKFFEGEYEINIDKLGYEKYHSRFEVAMGDFSEFNINLKAKRPGKAFFRSLIIPGRGQLYASDQDYRGRFWMGITYFVSTMACAGASGYMWNEYFSAKDEYNTSKNEYNVAVLLEDIQLTQDIMTVNHTSMTNKQNQAILLTGITSGLWLFNALDAFLFFPKEYKTKRLSLNIDNTILAGNPSALVELKLSF